MAGVTSKTSNSADDGTHAVVPENADGLVEPVKVGVDFSTTSPDDAAMATVGDNLGAESGAEGDTIPVDHITGETSSPNDVCGDANTAPKLVSVDEYLLPESPLFMKDNEYLCGFYDGRQYKELLPRSGNREDGGEAEINLRKQGVNLLLREVFLGLLCMSWANFARLLYCNMHPDGKIGYLTGESFSHLPVVVQLHCVHSAIRAFDLNTLFGLCVVANTLLQFHHILMEKATMAIRNKTTPKEPSLASDTMDKGMDEDDIDEDEVDDVATDIIKVVLFCIILICTTGRPFAWENWCSYFRNQDKDVSTNSDGPAHEESNATFLPTPLSQPTVHLFTTYLKGTLADGNSHLENTMPGWTGQGNTASIPSELKNPR